MKEKDLNEMGDRIRRIVQDAVESQNFQELNRQVKGILDDAVNGFQEGMKGAGAGFKEGMRGAGEGLRESLKNTGEDWKQAWKDAENPSFPTGSRSYQERYQKAAAPGYRPGGRMAARREEGQPALYAKRTTDQILGTVMAIAGFSLAGVFALSTIATLLALLLEPGLGILGILGTVILGAVMAAGLVLGICGQRARGRAKRFREYIKKIGTRGYGTVKELAETCGISQRKVRRDLKQMIERKMFLQGHMDEEETCIIVTDAMYQQYLLTRQEAQKKQQEQQKHAEQTSRLPEECRKILEEGQEYIRHIRQCNEELPGEEISQKLARLETIMTRIFEQVEKDPELAGELRKFMSYYLPTTKKLVDAYVDLEREPIAGDNVVKMKQEIEKTLDTINLAFENLLDGFFEEKAWDISSDISVLNTMLAQEGLTEDQISEKSRGVK